MSDKNTPQNMKSESKKSPKVALIHDYLVQYGGAEKTLEAICELYPEADIFTGLYDPTQIPSLISQHRIIFPKSKILQLFPKYTSFLMPLIFERFDLRSYDLVISDSACWAKGVLTTPSQLHISYIHTPPRFLYGYSSESAKRNAWYFKPIITVLDAFLRVWDYAAAHRPNYIISNSKEVQARILKFYGIKAPVIYPPVELPNTTDLVPNSNLLSKYDISGNYFLAWGRLAKYKNFDVLIKAFAQASTNNEFSSKGYSLVIAGTGAEERNLKKLVEHIQDPVIKSRIKIIGRVDEPTKLQLVSKCKGVINSVDFEDFGIVPLEAMAQGKPVLAHKSGGALETIESNKTGMFFDKLDPNNLSQALITFENNITEGMYDAQYAQSEVTKYSKERFLREFKEFVDMKWQEHQSKELPIQSQSSDLLTKDSENA